jgi:hypothetical protein
VKRSSLRPSGKPMKRGALRTKNPKRAAKRHTEAFGEGGRKADFVRANGCVIAQGDSSWCWGAIHAHHARTRAAGGSAKDLVGLCCLHHDEWHHMGAATFRDWYEIDLKAIAADLESRWLLTHTEDK